MSRHKLVKNLDLDEELDDFNGETESDYGEEISIEDKGMSPRPPSECQPSDHYAAILEHLRQGTAQVRDVLGSQVSITDKEIQDSLWHYYYDVDKTVDYLLSTNIRKNQFSGVIC